MYAGKDGRPVRAADQANGRHAQELAEVAALAPRRNRGGMVAVLTAPALFVRHARGVASHARADAYVPPGAGRLAPPAALRQLES